MRAQAQVPSARTDTPTRVSSIAQSKTNLLRSARPSCSDPGGTDNPRPGKAVLARHLSQSQPAASRRAFVAAGKVVAHPAVKLPRQEELPLGKGACQGRISWRRRLTRRGTAGPCLSFPDRSRSRHLISGGLPGGIRRFLPCRAMPGRPQEALHEAGAPWTPGLFPDWKDKDAYQRRLSGELPRRRGPPREAGTKGERPCNTSTHGRGSPGRRRLSSPVSICPKRGALGTLVFRLPSAARASSLFGSGSGWRSDLQGAGGVCVRAGAMQ
jgi:hypothetical protein